MKSLKYRRGISISIIALTLSPLILLYSNCSGFSSASFLSSQGSSGSGAGSGYGVPSEPVVAGEPAIGILNFSRLLQSFASVTNQPQILRRDIYTEPMHEWQQAAAGLATTGNPSLISAPTWMFIGDVAGSTCNQVVRTELGSNDPAARVFFPGFAYFTSSYGQDFKPTIRKMARAFWGRNETTEELALLLQFVDAVPDSGDVQRDNIEKLTGLCAGMLSSLASVQNI